MVRWSEMSQQLWRKDVLLQMFWGPGSVPCIAWRCSACGSLPPAWTWSPGHGTEPPSSQRTASPAVCAGPELGWTGSCSGPGKTDTGWIIFLLSFLFLCVGSREKVDTQTLMVQDCRHMDKCKAPTVQTFVSSQTVRTLCFSSSEDLLKPQRCSVLLFHEVFTDVLSLCERGRLQFPIWVLSWIASLDMLLRVHALQ